MMKKTVIALAMLAASVGAFAQTSTVSEGNWLVRLRAVNLDSVNKDNTGLGLSINNKWLPEADISYFITPNIAAELILTVPQRQRLSSSTLGGEIGSFRHLPPTLTVQYHFTNLNGVKPYVGVGINYTRFSSVDIAGGAADIKRNSFGPALQAGLDIPVTKNIYVNLDVKKVWIKTDVKVGGANVGSFKANPMLVGVGVGYRF